MVDKSLLQLCEAVDPLIAALADSDTWVQRAAAKSLGEIGDLKAVGPLLELLKTQDREDPVQNAIEGLRRLKDLRAVEPLIDLLDHPNLSIHAWGALQQIAGQDFAREKSALMRWWQAQKERKPAGPTPK